MKKNLVKSILRRTPVDSEEVLEKRLIDECKKGHIDSYEYFVQKNQNLLYHLAMQILRDEPLVQEAVQLTFIKGWRKIGGFKNNARFSTWLYRQCVNVSWNLWHTRMRERGYRPSERNGEPPQLLLEQVLSSESPLERALIHQEIHSLVLQAMDKLPAEQRLVLLLREMQGLDYEEIARTLKCREGIVMSRLFHARRKIRQLLEKII